MKTTPKVTRRQALKSITATASAFVASPSSRAQPAAIDPLPLLTRGVILRHFDLSLKDWPERCAKAGINTIGLHVSQRADVLADFIARDEGQHFLSRCAELGIEVEYELHAMGDLLSREYFARDQTLFRMNENGSRTRDANCNPFSAEALEIIAEKAVDYARVFAPTTNRYFYWPDDGAKWDFSPEGRELNASDQALLVENRILQALRQHVNPNAQLAHLSYHQTLPVPGQVKPEPGMFLEFAPIMRDYSSQIIKRDAATLYRNKSHHPNPPTNAGYLDFLAENLSLFGARNAQALEYWLDASLFSRRAHRNRPQPAVKVPWNDKVCRSDVAAYRKLGIRHITTFACSIDADYAERHGDPQPLLNAYGEALA